MQMGDTGQLVDHGYTRVALTKADKAGRDLFSEWCSQAGCSLSIDTMGNLFFRRAGINDELPPVITGSHLDTQPTGGKFDGVYGVLAGLEVIRTLNEHDVVTDHPLEIVVWTNEEGARFAPAMIGSGVWADIFTLDYGLSRADKEGITIEQALIDTGFKGDKACRVKPVKAAFELHIEQGPILEQEEKQIGIVSGAQGINWLTL
ncbi:MAG: hydantoinase/carbamoylase family amidase, partial [Pseudomonadales bacterium]